MAACPDESKRCGSAFRNVLEANHVPANKRYFNALVEDSANSKFYMYDACGSWVELITGGGSGGSQTLTVLSNNRLQISGGNTVTLPYDRTALVAAYDAPAEVKARAQYVCTNEDDQVLINTALANYANVELSEGQFTISSPILVYTDSNLWGQGKKTVIFATPGFNNQNMIQPATSSGPTYFVEIHHFRLDGNKDNQTGTFDFGLGHGIHGLRAHTWNIHDMHIKETYRAGIRLAGDSGDYATNNSVHDNRIEGTGWQSVLVHFFAPSNHIHNNILSDTQTTPSIQLDNTDNTVMGNHIHGSADHGILVTGSRNKLIGNTVELGGNPERANPDDNPDGDNIHIGADAKGTIVSGNTLFDAARAGVADYGTDTIISGGNELLNVREDDYQQTGILLGDTSVGALVSGNNLVDPNEAMTAFDIDPAAAGYRIGPNLPDDDDNVASSRHIWQQQVIAPTTDLTTGDGKAYFVVPQNYDGLKISRVHARVITAGVTGTTDIQIANVTDAVDILSTKLTIDTVELGSNTAAIPAVINTSNQLVSAYDLLRVDIDAIHSGTAAKGLIVTIEFRLP